MILHLSDNSIEIRADSIPLRDVLEMADINPLSVIVAREGIVIPAETTVYSEDTLKVYRISHGG
jgi:sulfur carrier protein ThiS